MARVKICPWWLAYGFDNRLRRIFQKPERILAPYVKEGMTVLDLGCGMGFFTIAMAKMINIQAEGEHLGSQAEGEHLGSQEEGEHLGSQEEGEHLGSQEEGEHLGSPVRGRGKVIAVDLQERMLDQMKRRAKKQGVLGRIQPVLCQPDDILVKEKVDFALAMWMLHEVGEPENFLKQVRDCLKPEARFLIVEPKHHVKLEQFQKLIALAEQVGLKRIETPQIRLSRAALLGLAA